MRRARIHDGAGHCSMSAIVPTTIKSAPQAISRTRARNSTNPVARPLPSGGSLFTMAFPLCLAVKLQYVVSAHFAGWRRFGEPHGAAKRVIGAGNPRSERARQNTTTRTRSARSNDCGTNRLAESPPPRACRKHRCCPGDISSTSGTVRRFGASGESDRRAIAGTVCNPGGTAANPERPEADPTVRAAMTTTPGGASIARGPCCHGAREYLAGVVSLRGRVARVT